MFTYIQECLADVSFDRDLNLDKYHKEWISDYHTWGLWQRVSPAAKNQVGGDHQILKID